MDAGAPGRGGPAGDDRHLRRDAGGRLAAFQAGHGLPVSGVTDAATWQALLALTAGAGDLDGGGPKG